MSDLWNSLDAVRKALVIPPFGLITDIDGTISEIVPFPREAWVSPVCRESLAIYLGDDVSDVDAFASCTKKALKAWPWALSVTRYRIEWQRRRILPSAGWATWSASLHGSLKLFQG